MGAFSMDDRRHLSHSISSGSFEKTFSLGGDAIEEGSEESEPEEITDPNIKEYWSILFGDDPDLAREIIKRIRKRNQLHLLPATLVVMHVAQEDASHRIFSPVERRKLLLNFMKYGEDKLYSLHRNKAEHTTVIAIRAFKFISAILVKLLSLAKKHALSGGGGEVIALIKKDPAFRELIDQVRKGWTPSDEASFSTEELIQLIEKRFSENPSERDLASKAFQDERDRLSELAVQLDKRASFARMLEGQRSLELYGKTPQERFEQTSLMDQIDIMIEAREQLRVTGERTPELQRSEENLLTMLTYFRFRYPEALLLPEDVGRRSRFMTLEGELKSSVKMEYKNEVLKKIQQMALHDLKDEVDSFESYWQLADTWIQVDKLGEREKKSKATVMKLAEKETESSVIGREEETAEPSFWGGMKKFLMKTVEPLLPGRTKLVEEEARRESRTQLLFISTELKKRRSELEALTVELIEEQERRVVLQADIIAKPPLVLGLYRDQVSRNREEEAQRPAEKLSASYFNFTKPKEFFDEAKKIRENLERVKVYLSETKHPDILGAVDPAVRTEQDRQVIIYRQKLQLRLEAMSTALLYRLEALSRRSFEDPADQYRPAMRDSQFSTVLRERFNQLDLPDREIFHWSKEEIVSALNFIRQHGDTKTKRKVSEVRLTGVDNFVYYEGTLGAIPIEFKQYISSDEELKQVVSEPSVGQYLKENKRYLPLAALEYHHEKTRDLLLGIELVDIELQVNHFNHSLFVASDARDIDGDAGFVDEQNRLKENQVRLLGEKRDHLMRLADLSEGRADKIYEETRFHPRLFHPTKDEVFSPEALQEFEIYSAAVIRNFSPREVMKSDFILSLKKQEELLLQERKELERFKPFILFSIFPTNRNKFYKAGVRVLNQKEQRLLASKRWFAERLMTTLLQDQKNSFAGYSVQHFVDLEKQIRWLDLGALTRFYRIVKSVWQEKRAEEEAAERRYKEIGLAVLSYIVGESIRAPSNFSEGKTVKFDTDKGLISATVSDIQKMIEALHREPIRWQGVIQLLQEYAGFYDGSNTAIFPFVRQAYLLLYAEEEEVTVVLSDQDQALNLALREVVLKRMEALINRLLEPMAEGAPWLLPEDHALFKMALRNDPELQNTVDQTVQKWMADPKFHEEMYSEEFNIFVRDYASKPQASRFHLSALRKLIQKDEHHCDVGEPLKIEIMLGVRGYLDYVKRYGRSILSDQAMRDLVAELREFITNKPNKILSMKALQSVVEKLGNEELMVEARLLAFKHCLENPETIPQFREYACSILPFGIDNLSSAAYLIFDERMNEAYDLYQEPAVLWDPALQSFTEEMFGQLSEPSKKMHVKWLSSFIAAAEDQEASLETFLNGNEEQENLLAFYGQDHLPLVMEAIRAFVNRGNFDNDNALIALNYIAKCLDQPVMRSQMDDYEAISARIKEYKSLMVEIDLSLAAENVPNAIQKLRETIAEVNNEALPEQQRLDASPKVRIILMKVADYINQWLPIDGSIPELQQELLPLFENEYLQHTYPDYIGSMRKNLESFSLLQRVIESVRARMTPDLETLRQLSGTIYIMPRMKNLWAPLIRKCVRDKEYEIAKTLIETLGMAEHFSVDWREIRLSENLTEQCQLFMREAVAWLTLTLPEKEDRRAGLEARLAGIMSDTLHLSRPSLIAIACFMSEFLENAAAESPLDQELFFKLEQTFFPLLNEEAQQAIVKARLRKFSYVGFDFSLPALNRYQAAASFCKDVQEQNEAMLGYLNGKLLGDPARLECIANISKKLAPHFTISDVQDPFAALDRILAENVGLLTGEEIFELGMGPSGSYTYNGKAVILTGLRAGLSTVFNERISDVGQANALIQKVKAFVVISAIAEKIQEKVLESPTNHEGIKGDNRTMAQLFDNISQKIESGNFYDIAFMSHNRFGYGDVLRARVESAPGVLMRP